MFRYNANTEGYPHLGDYVETVRSGDFNDGFRGRIGGWGDLDMTIALVLLDKPLDDGRTIVGWPIVCLTEVKEEVKLEPNPGLGNLCSESVALDKDGYIIWNGGAPRPVSDDTIVAVKVRSGIPRSPIDALYWPQICWTHRGKDDPMNAWDIVAYKVVK